MTFALGFGPVALKKIYETGFRCGQESDIVDIKPLGKMRVSFDAMSTLKDVEVFIAFVEQTFINRQGGELTSYEAANVRKASKKTENTAILTPSSAMKRWGKWKNRLKL